MSVYDTEAFAERVNFAASYISAGRETTRSFDTCFEMHDGTAVALALYRRTVKNPDTALARNLWRYLCRESVEREATEHAHERDLRDFAARLRDKGRRDFEAFMARQGYRTELTPAGEQTVIPGCERDAAPSVKQMELF